ncbi:glycosyltransferase involved in cell wall biosynthesis [Phyllobacterium myrsinacearum]|uniref:Glycosyltransferase involved in cell wall biosynthesis n=1 Tax=Phyllobacterium myrsinacearum TaxID=28101 RepID=A0A839EFI4_9HYPH|nr:glycosyltransferase involved in cell wall biosynthesis [Phyllobacterium myrsinacearum]
MHIVSYGGEDIRKKAFQAARVVPHLEDITWHLLADPNVKESIFCLQGRKTLHAVLTGASFVHIHGVWEPLLRKAASIARGKQIPYCVQPHGMLDVWSLKQKAFKKRLALRFGYRKMLSKAKFILALNTDEARLLEPLNLASPHLIIPNGVFLEEFERLPASGFFKERLPYIGDKRIILFLSRLHTKKGLDILAKAYAYIASSYPDVDLVVAGPDGGARDGFVDAIAQLDLNDRVHLVGALYGEDKLRALVDATCFCLPSRQEGFSVAILEALACGLPVVISDACHFPEVRVARAGAVVSLVPEDVASGLSAILDDTTMASAMGENGRRLIREQYTWPQIASSTIKGYTGILSTPMPVTSQRVSAHGKL